MASNRHKIEIMVRKTQDFLISRLILSLCLNSVHFVFLETTTLFLLIMNPGYVNALNVEK